MAFVNVNKYLTFEGAYFPLMIIMLIFLVVALFVGGDFWLMVAVFGLIMIYYDLDFVRYVKQNSKNFHLLGYFALISLVIIGVGIFNYYLLALGALLAGPGFYIYRRNVSMSIEYGGR
ncbi:MAG: hypothetical protein QW292_11105 [Candidatus Parvarchaeota archaeon]